MGIFFLCDFQFYGKTLENVNVCEEVSFFSCGEMEVNWIFRKSYEDLLGKIEKFDEDSLLGVIPLSVLIYKAAVA